MQLKQKAQVPCRAQALASERGQGLSCASAQGLSWTSGQGTIEYLVILAVIVVLGLVIVSLISNIMISPTEQISSTTDKLNATSGPITILDSVTDSQGGTLLRFRNNTGESITLTKISLDGVENDFSERVSLNDSRTLSLNSLVGCSGGKKSYKVIIYYTTQNGLTKTLNLGSKIIDCTQEITIPPEAIQTNSCFARGNGTLANPKIICTCSDLQNMDQNKTAYYSLGQDINCAATSTWNDNAGFTPVGNVSDSFCESQDCPEGLCCNNSVWNCESWCGSVWNSGSFSGSLNGNNHSILGLYINRSDEDNVGLFGFLSETTNQTISNIRFSDANIIGHDNVGVLAGNNGYQIASLSNIFITNSNVRGNDSVGSLIGLAGSWWGGSADAVSFEGNIFGHDNLGGLIGNANQFSITNSTATGIVSGNNNIGGIIGAGGRITTGSTTFMDVNGNQNVGGAAGSGTNISSTIAYGDVNGVTNVGGLIGSGTAVSSSASGNVLGQDYVGGLAGITSALTDSNSIGNVTGRNYVGGLAGSTSGTITRCSSESRVNGAGYVSGLVGYATSITINFSKSSGTINGTGTYVGGILGFGELTDINYCNSTSNIFSSAIGGNVGGIAGDIWSGGNNGNIYDSNYAGSIKTNSSLVGGIAGQITRNVYRSHSSGDINGVNYLGGVVGTTNGRIYDSYSQMNIKGSNYLGGLAGVSTDVNRSYATGDVNGNAYVGGLVGSTKYGAFYMLVQNSFATGNVTGGANSGGLVGEGSVASTTNSYYVDTSPSNSYGTLEPSGATFFTGNVSDAVNKKRPFWSVTQSMLVWNFTSTWQEGSTGEYPKLR